MPLLSLPCRFQTPNQKSKRQAHPQPEAWQVKEASMWLDRLHSWLRRTLSCGSAFPSEAVLIGDFSRAKDKKEQQLCDSLRQFFDVEGMIFVLRNAMGSLLLQPHRQAADKLRRIRTKICTLEKDHSMQEAAIHDCIVDVHSLTFKSSILTKLKEQISKYYSFVSTLGDELLYLGLEGWPSNHNFLEYFKEEVHHVWRRVAVYEDLYVRILRCGEDSVLVSDEQLADMKRLLHEYNLEIADFNRELTELLRDEGLTEADPSVRRLQHLVQARFEERQKVLRLYLHLMKSGDITSLGRGRSELRQALADVEYELLWVSDELTCLLLDNCPSQDDYVRHLKFILKQLTKEKQMLQVAACEAVKPPGRQQMRREHLLAEFNWLLEMHDRYNVVLQNHLSSLLTHGCLQCDDPYHELMQDLSAQWHTSKLCYLQLYVDFLRFDTSSIVYRELLMAGLQEQLVNYETAMVNVRDEIHILMSSDPISAKDSYMQHVELEVKRLYEQKLNFMDTYLHFCCTQHLPRRNPCSSGSCSPSAWTGSSASS